MIEVQFSSSTKARQQNRPLAHRPLYPNGQRKRHKTTMKILILLSLLSPIKSFTSPITHVLFRQPLATEPTTTVLQAKKYVVIGGGWGGWGAAKALCENDDVDVTLIDALPDPTGVSGGCVLC
jgi:NADPH-dependent 2,4-dienoyl-CoA reductase/sulfur reductase-like enzyme